MKYQSTIHWAPDIKEAAKLLAHESSKFHPANRKEFVIKVAMEAVRILRDKQGE